MIKDAAIVDAQIHIWSAQRPDKPWPSWGPAAADRHRPAGAFTAEHAIAMMDEVGVGRAVLIPPAWQGERNEDAVAAVHSWPARFRVMGRVQAMRPPDARATLTACGPDRPMLGVRMLFTREEDWAAARNGSLDRIWRHLHSKKLPVMVFAPGHAEFIGQLAKRYPGARFIVDHLGLRPQDRGFDLVSATRGVLDLARLSNVAVKASALPCFVDKRSLQRDVGRLLRAVVDAFGSSRVFWGSDATRLPCSYARAITVVSTAQELSVDERTDVLGRGLLNWLDWRPLAALAETGLP